MPEMFNPNDASPDQFAFEARAAAIEQRKRQLAEYMKQQRNSPEMPEGRMVGGQYIAPSWTENLAAAMQPAMQRWNSDAEGKQLQAEQDAYNKADQAAGLAHIQSRPQSRPGYGANEMDNEAVPAVTPTNQAMAEWAQKGAAIPSRRDVVSKIMADLEVNAPIREEARAQKNLDREDQQAERKDNLAANLQLRREQLVQQGAEAQRRSEDRRYTDDQRAESASEAHAIQLQIAQMGADARRDAAGAARDAKAAALANKPLPNAVHKELSEAESNAATMQQLSSTFDPSFSGLKATIRNAAAPYDPTGTLDDAGAQWWKQYKKQASLVERHALFGAALTPTEKASWDSADINQGMNPDVVQKNLAIRKALADKVFANGVDRYEKGGYPQVRNAFDPVAPRSTGSTTGSWDAPSAGKGGPETWSAGQRAAVEADIAKLPSGTEYQINGRKYRKN